MNDEHRTDPQATDSATTGNGEAAIDTIDTIDTEVRALRQDVAALRDLLLRPGQARAVPHVATTPQQEQIARELRDQLIRSEDQLTEARRQLQRLERSLDRAETERRRLLESRTWKLGKAAARTVTTPITMAKAVYSWLLTVLPGPANRALRRAVAQARGGRPVTMAGPKAVRARAAGTSGALVPIPVHGPEGVGAALTSPAVLLVAYGFDEAALTALVDCLNELRRAVDGLRVLVVTDSPAFHVFRARSMLFEYLPGRAEWERHGFERSYDEFRQARFTELLRVYRPDRVVHVHSIDDLRAMPPSLFASA